MSTDVGKSQRDAIKQLSPPWLSNGVAEKILYSIGLTSDALLEKWNEAVQSRFPGFGDPSVLPLLGADRVMGQGLNETNAGFTARLQRAFDTWQHAGARSAILGQVVSYLQNPANTVSGQIPIGTIVNVAGGKAAWDTYYNTSNLSAPAVRRVVSPTNWNWDGVNPWWSSFLILHFPLITSTATGTAASITTVSGGMATVTGLTGMTTSVAGKMLVVSGAGSSANNGTLQIASYISATSVQIANGSAVGADANNGAISWTLASYPVIAPAPAWGTPGATWGGANAAWGVNVAPAFFASLRNLVRLWKSADNFFPWIIISFGGGDGTTGKEFSPNSAQGSGNPDGTWGTWGKTVGGVSVASRNSGVSLSQFDAFCDGTGVYNLALATVPLTT